MKTVSGAYNTFLDGEQQTPAICFKVVQTRYMPRILTITNANPGVVKTIWPHGFATGDGVKFRHVRGMTALNRNEYAVTVIDPWRFSIGVDTTAFAPYTHKGIAQRILGHTSFRRAIILENITYKPTLAFTPQSRKQGLDMSVDKFDLLGVLQNAAKVELAAGVIEQISDEDLAAGRYSNAEFEFFEVDYTDLSKGRMNLISGRFGEVTLHRGSYNVKLAGKTAFLQETLQKVYTNNCRSDLGDDLDTSELEHKLQQGYGCKVRLDPQFWQASTAVTVRPVGDAGLGSIVKPTIYNGRHFWCSTAGTTGLTEPVWNTTIGGTTVDGTAVWTTKEALTKYGVVHDVIDRRRWIDNDRSEAPIAGIGGVSTLFPIIAVNVAAHRFTIAGDLVANFPVNSRFQVVGSPENDETYTVESVDLNIGNTRIVVGEDIPGSSSGGSIVGRLGSLVSFFTYGLVTFTSGKNIGIAREVRTFSVTTVDGVTFTGPGAFEVFEAFPFDIEVGDAYEAKAGCDKSIPLCRDKFSNIRNRRAEDNIPGVDKVMLFPDPK